jgi:iron(III) transport system ATP-binding protein
LAVSSVTGVDVGDDCVVSIRPEHVEMLKPDAVSGDRANAWKGTVQTRLFMGEVMDYQISLGDLVLRCRSSAFERFSTGDDVGVLLDAERCIALPRG